MAAAKQNAPILIEPNGCLWSLCVELPSPSPDTLSLANMDELAELFLFNSVNYVVLGR
jgi:hypothetical protein